MPPSPQPDLAALLTASLAGRFPPVDGGWDRVPPWKPGVEAVVAFTGHAFLAVEDDVADETLVRLGVDGYGGAHRPRLVHTLAGEDGWVDALDAVLVAHGGPPPGVVGTGSGGRTAGSQTVALTPRPDLLDHPRTAYARGIRDDVVTLGRPEGTPSLVTLGRGLGGLPEIGIETHPRDAGLAVAMIRAALARCEPGSCVVAAVAPGNARALRTFLRAGFTPVASVQLFRRAG